MSPFTYKSLGVLYRVSEGMKRESKARHSIWRSVCPINSYCYCCYCYCLGGRVVIVTVWAVARPGGSQTLGRSACLPSSAPTVAHVISSCALASQNSQGLSEHPRPLQAAVYPDTLFPCLDSSPPPFHSPSLPFTAPSEASPLPSPSHRPSSALQAQGSTCASFCLRVQGSCPHCQSVSNSRTKTGPLLPLCPQHLAQGLAGSRTKQMFAK